MAEDDEQHGVPADVWSCLDVYPHGGGSNDNNSSPPAAVCPEVWATLLFKTFCTGLELLSYIMASAAEESLCCDDHFDSWGQRAWPSQTCK